MQTGAITQYIDVAQLTLYGFWIFFAGLIYYLHQENKREGYPLESDRSGGRIDVQGFPAIPKPKTYVLRDGRTVSVPNRAAPIAPANARLTGRFLGAPIEPEGDPMLAGVGPGAWAERPDIVDTTEDLQPRLLPLRVVSTLGVDRQDPDPRGLPVLGADGAVAGEVVDLWVDQAEMLFRYLELKVPGLAHTVLLPMNFARVKAQRVEVRAILAAQFAGVPALRQPERITMLEEEKVMAYYGAGTLYATAARAEPLL